MGVIRNGNRIHKKAGGSKTAPGIVAPEQSGFIKACKERIENAEDNMKNEAENQQKSEDNRA